MAEEKPIVMISSTAFDLPEHRKEVMDACLRQGMFPIMMEHLTAASATALEESLRIVDRADIYLGVFAFRYGTVPDGELVSITEAEYDRAVERGIPRLIFLMSDDHPVKPSDVETGEGAGKLKKLKERLKKEQVAGFFDSPTDLRAQVVQALNSYRKPDLQQLDPIPSSIPDPPKVYVAHEYTLLQTYGLVGRQKELNYLTEWVGDPKSEIYKAHILTVVAIGGMGKSALTWKWFNDIAPQEMDPLAGRMWWSFYESNASIDNFVIRALAYVSRKPVEEVQKMAAEDREAQLLNILNEEPFLIVLDGLERILIAYARMDAAHLSDDDLDKATANFVTRIHGLPESTAQSFTGEHRLRKTTDPRAGSFLRKLSNVRTAKILVSTRLYPADLQTITGDPIGSSGAIFLAGLTDDDALNLWREYKVTGSKESLLPLFTRIEKHPLLIQSLAGEISRDRENPGDFDKWQKNHPSFDPFSLPLKQVKSHVLEFALGGLDEKERKVLNTIAAFRMPGQYDTLAALLIGEGEPCADARGLDEILTELEDRGLVGWDKRSNRYDLHPIVRGVVWGGLGDDTRQGVYSNLYAHFEALPMIENYLEVDSLEDLTSAIELYNTLIGMGRYDDAFVVLRDRLDQAMHFRLGVSGKRIEILEMVFPDGTDNLPRLVNSKQQGYTLNSLALAYDLTGQPGRATPLYRRYTDISVEGGDNQNLAVGLCNLSDSLRLTGELRASADAARRALEMTRHQKSSHQQAVSLQWLGLTLAASGEVSDSERALRRALRIWREGADSQGEGLSRAFLAQTAIWSSKYREAVSFADQAWELAHVDKNAYDFIRAARLQGQAALVLNNFTTIDERLHYALTRARAVNQVEEELQALNVLAELRRRQGDEKSAREFLADVWEFAERGPYPLFHVDALNVLAQIERDAANTDAAKEAATKAYQLAWCDGPPYAYHWGLIKAEKHLKELGVDPPDMPPFDESNFEPMPEVEIDPEDEFHVGDVSED